MVSNLMGRVFMSPDLDDPFVAAERQLDGGRLGRDFDCVVFDFHAEATSEKVCFAHFVDGRASLVVGTHTHVPTADAQLLPRGSGDDTSLDFCWPGASGAWLRPRSRRPLRPRRGCPGDS